jgi:hypothetical protein
MEKDWTTIYSTDQLYIAELAKQMLLDNGIEAVVVNKRDSAYNTFGDIEVYVNRDNVIKALLLIKEFDH